tara:strand:- start:1563 stop:1823 length:261 start_codon:yes stop_codon:yes gene_type:complete
MEGQEIANKRRTIMESDLCKLSTLKERIIKALIDMPTPEDMPIEEKVGYGCALYDAIQIINQLDKKYNNVGEDWLAEKLNRRNRKN